MKIKFLLAAVLLATAFWSCSKSEKSSKILVAYYSQTGATKAVAEELQRQLGADIVTIEAEEPYDTDYASTVTRWRQERDNGVKVAIRPLEVEIEKYDTIFLGFPVWGGSYASPIATFLADNSLAGKIVVAFATFGSGGIETATADVVKAQPEATVVEGYGVRNARVGKAKEEITRFLVENGYIDGEVARLPDYGMAEPVTDDDVTVFETACGDYQFPLGTPVSVAKRSYGGTTDYKFEVKSETPDGNENRSTIFVLITDGGSPEFTRVVR